jgi:energy-coupling factor transport system ATP-binding protein
MSFFILEHITLKASRGEIIGVVGRNGAGKTTFSRALCGLHKNTEGTFLLVPYKTRHPNTLSGGQKQRVAAAVSMVCGKDILVFDEPTSGLDYDSMIQVAGLLEKLAQ